MKDSGQKVVYTAEPYQSREMGSLGRASYMLMQQYQFPHTFDSRLDRYTTADHDRIFGNDYDHARACCARLVGHGEAGIGYWAQKAKPEEVLEFIVAMLKADPQAGWTGWRVLGTVNRGNGYPVWTLELFAKHPDSDTKVYSGPIAPNVGPGPRYNHETGGRRY